MKYLKSYKLYESVVTDQLDDYICARSSDWILCSFNDYVSYINFEHILSPNEVLTRGPFSHGTESYYKMINGIDVDASKKKFEMMNHMFDMYNKKYGTLYTLLSISNPKELYQFNCDGDGFYGIFDKSLNNLNIKSYKQSSNDDVRIVEPFKDYKLRKIYSFFENVLLNELDYTNDIDEDKIRSSFSKL